MSTEKWRERVERFRKTDPVIAAIVILALLALLAHEGVAVVTGRVPFANASGDGPFGRILLGLIAAVTAFWVRQARKDVLTDTTITAEVRDRLTSSPDDATARVIADLNQQHDRMIDTLREAFRLERHDLRNDLQNLQNLKDRIEADFADAKQRAALLEQLNTQLTNDLAACAKTKPDDKGFHA